MNLPPLGIGVITYARLESLQECLRTIARHTETPYRLVIADDGSPDDTVAWARNAGYTVVTGDNRGCAWNKNRALHYLLTQTDCDPILLVEDDCFPAEPGWEKPWIAAAHRWRHVNWTTEFADRRSEIARAGDSEMRFSGFSGQCTITSRKALERIGYLDTRFAGYGFEHVEWTYRFRWHYEREWRLPPDTFPCLTSGVRVRWTHSYFNSDEMKHNARIHRMIQAEPLYRPAWNSEEERLQLESEVLSATGKILVTPRTTPSPTRTSLDEREMIIYCGNSVETWSDSTVDRGIGGSEEAVVYLSREMASRGWKVTVYNACGTHTGEFSGVTYLPYWQFDPHAEHNWLVLWRRPGVAEFARNAKKLWIWNHDVVTDDDFSQRILDRADRILFLSRWAREQCRTIPAPKVFITNNGIVPAHFEALPPREPHSLFWGSSYDRGLECLMRDILPHVRREIPDTTLHICYGWETLVKLRGADPRVLEWKAAMERLMDAPWIMHHGRVGHQEVARIMGRCAVFAYPTEFGETNCITLQKVQAAGCYPVVTAVGALPERILSGIVATEPDAPGIYHNVTNQKAFADAVIQALLTAPYVDRERALREFAWSATADQWEHEAGCPLATSV